VNGVRCATGGEEAAAVPADEKAGEQPEKRGGSNEAADSDAGDGGAGDSFGGSCRACRG
jgi:hypothetical protein